MGQERSRNESRGLVDVDLANSKAPRQSTGALLNELVELTVIIPVFNEINTIDDVLRRVIQESTPKELVIVNDGSSDGTSEFLDAWPSGFASATLPSHVSRVKILHHSSNRGKGAAIRTGLEHANSRFVVVQDADLEVLPTEYPSLLSPLVAGEADFVIGYRRGLASSSSRLTLGAGVWLLNVAVRLIYGLNLRDEACCFKVLRTQDLKRMNLECNGFEFCSEVVAKAARLGLRFSEVPISYFPRDVAQGKKLRLHDGWNALATLWRHRKWHPGSKGRS